MRTIDLLVERTARHSYGSRGTPYDRPGRESRMLARGGRSGRYFERDLGSASNISFF